MGVSRALGALLCVVCAIIVVAYIGYFISRWWPIWKFTGHGAPLWVVLPVVIGVWVLAGLGFWLGWIMASTKEISPTPTPTVETKPKKRKKR